MKILLKDARILKMDDTPILKGDIVVSENRIVYIGSSSKSYGPFDVIHDCHGNIVMPGFKNAHSHSGMTFLRGKSDGYPLNQWLNEIVFPREALLTPDDVYHLSKVAFLEYLTSGITACFDQYFYPLSIAKASVDIGMRTVLMATNNKDTDVATLVKLYHCFNDDPESLVGYCLGIHAEYTTPKEEFEGIYKAVHLLKAPFYTHLSETKKEVLDCYKRRGMSPVKFLSENGYFAFGGGGYHCVFLNDEDIEIFRKKNLFVITCPGSNCKLADGVIPLKKYLDKGLKVAIGTDGPASNNALDMFKEMALTYSLSNIVTKKASSISPYEILKMATVNGARAMNLNDADTLAVGKKADLIEIDLSLPNMHPFNDLIGSIVYAGSKANVKMTMINGKILYENGRFHVGQDVKDIFQKAEEITLRLEKELKEKTTV